MSNDEITITFHGSSFLELSARETSIFIDPVFSSSRRGRRLRGTTRPCDYLFLTQATEAFDDALDVLEDSDAVLVASPGLCRAAQDELGLGRGRVLDLEAWEIARDDAFRVTAVPIHAPTVFDDGQALLEDLSGVAGLVEIQRAISRLPVLAGALRGARTLRGALPSWAGKPGLGFLFELGSGQRVLFLGGGVHGGVDERDLEDIASLAEIDALVLDVGTQRIEPVVRAARLFAAPSVLLYRGRDAYARGRRAQALPVSAYTEAIAEDQGDRVDALHLRPGDRFVLSAPPAAAAPAKSPEGRGRAAGARPAPDAVVKTPASQAS